LRVKGLRKALVPVLSTDRVPDDTVRRAMQMAADHRSARRQASAFSTHRGSTAAAYAPVYRGKGAVPVRPSVLSVIRLSPPICRSVDAKRGCRYCILSAASRREAAVQCRSAIFRVVV
jgi:hypothetical protein